MEKKSRKMIPHTPESGNEEKDSRVRWPWTGRKKQVVVSIPTLVERKTSSNCTYELEYRMHPVDANR